MTQNTFQARFALTTLLLDVLKSKTVFDADWTVQGFGFARLRYPGMRVHFWHDFLQYDPIPTLIHDHPWNFGSMILSGLLCDTAFNPVDNETGGYLRQQIQCGESCQVLNPPVPCKLEIIDDIQVQYLFPGSTYGKKTTEFHSTSAQDGSISIITREQTSSEIANVIYKKEEGFVKATPRIPTDQEKFAVVSKAIASLTAQLKSMDL